MAVLILLKGIITGISVSAPLGPVAAVTIQRTMSKGFKYGFLSGMGATLGDTFYGVVAGFGLTMVRDFLLDHQVVLRTAGSLLLFYMAFRLFFTNPGKQIRRLRAKRNTLFSDMGSVLVLTLSNPLTILGFGVAYTALGLVTEEMNTFTSIVSALGVFIGCTLWWGALNFFVNRYRSRITLRKLLVINQITAVIIALFGVGVLVSIFFL